MRQTLSDLITICQNGAGQDTSTASKNLFIQGINRADVFITSKLPSYLNEVTRTFATVASQQYYHYPPGIREVESLSITINSVIYPLTPIFSNKKWNELNAITIQNSAIPKYYFKRQRDFGIWPIPQDAYTGTITETTRGGGLYFEDYTTGTVAVTENDETVTVTTGDLSAGEVKADFWFCLADDNGEPRGNWYRIETITDTTHMELESVFEESTESGAKYIIGQTPEGPEEGHELRAYRALADYFMSFKQSSSKAKPWQNMFWTGDPDISRAVAERSNTPWTGGGLLGLINDYTDRDSSQLVKRGSSRQDATSKVWAQTITSS